MNCLKCNDTVVIETGSNDLPCSCPAGDMAVFNVSGHGQVSGSVLKTANKEEADFWEKLGMGEDY